MTKYPSILERLMSNQEPGPGPQPTPEPQPTTTPEIEPTIPPDSPIPNII